MPLTKWSLWSWYIYNLWNSLQESGQQVHSRGSRACKDSWYQICASESACRARKKVPTTFGKNEEAKIYHSCLWSISRNSKRTVGLGISMSYIIIHNPKHLHIFFSLQKLKQWNDWAHHIASFFFCTCITLPPHFGRVPHQHPQARRWWYKDMFTPLIDVYWRIISGRL